MYFGRVREVVSAAVADGAFPAAVVEVGRTDAVLWREAFGRLSDAPDARRTLEDTVFDLASLTKVVASATLAMRLIERRVLGLDDPVARWLPTWRGRDREQVTVRDLLAHASGLTAWLPFYRDCEGRQEFEAAICALPLEYEPRTRSIYSDLGFILLGFILEQAAGPLARQFDAFVADALDPDAAGGPPGVLMYRPPPATRPAIAPTGIDPWRGRLLVGEVHDENAWALGGVAGHAGLFGDAPSTGAFARLMLEALAGRPGATSRLAPRELVARFTTNAGIPRSSRALGWDMMLPTSSCGTRMSAAAFGHTGFTGTSLWLDPARDLYVVFLTNRVYSSRKNDAIRLVRPALHDAVIEAVEASRGSRGSCGTARAEPRLPPEA